MKANLSIWGMYQYNNTLFNDMTIPTQVNRQTLLDNILLECSEMQILFTNWDFLKSAIDAWSAKSCVSWQKICDLLDLEYNPIENYDRIESWTDTGRHTGTVMDESSSRGSVTKEDTTSERLHHTGESSLDHDGDKTETIDSTVTTSGRNTRTEDIDEADSKSSTGSSSMHHVGEDTADESTSESDINTNINSVNGFNGTLSSQGMSPHDKAETTASISKTLDHDGTNEYTDTGSTSESVTGTHTGDNEITDVSSGSSRTQANNSGTDDYLDEYEDEYTDERSGSLESEENHSDTGTATRTNNLVDTLEHTARIHGNIGTVTAQKMITESLELAKVNIYDIIVEEFKQKFCLNVYY